MMRASGGALLVGLCLTMHGLGCADSPTTAATPATVFSFGLGTATASAGWSRPVECVRLWTESRYVIGYNHIVHLLNDCDFGVRCSVWTSLNPIVQAVSVASGEHAGVVTFLGAATPHFTPYVVCRADNAVTDNAVTDNAVTDDEETVDPVGVEPSKDDRADVD